MQAAPIARVGRLEVTGVSLKNGRALASLGVVGLRRPSGRRRKRNGPLRDGGEEKSRGVWES